MTLLKITQSEFLPFSVCGVFVPFGSRKRLTPDFLRELVTTLEAETLILLRRRVSARLSSHQTGDGCLPSRLQGCRLQSDRQRSRLEPEQTRASSQSDVSKMKRKEEKCLIIEALSAQPKNAKNGDELGEEFIIPEPFL